MVSTARDSHALQVTRAPFSASEAAGCARSKKLQAQAHLGLAGCWAYRHPLKKVRRELNKARRLTPGYEHLDGFEGAAFLYASRVLRDWHDTGNAQTLREGLHWLELYLKNRKPSKLLSLFHLAEDATDKLQQQERFRQTLATYGIQPVGEGSPFALAQRLRTIVRVRGK